MRHTFTLPPGYSFEPPAAVQGATVPDKGYGGADISQAFDAAGVHYVACNAWGPGDPSFRWRAFRREGTRYVEVALPFLATGRGEQDIQWYDGRSWGIAWTGSEFSFDLVPGFAAFPSIPSLDSRLTVVEQAAIGSDPRVTALIERVAALEAMSGGWVLLPAPVTAPAWEARPLDGGASVNIPAVFGVPRSTGYLVRLVVQASAPNVRARAGTPAAPFFLTACTQAPNVQMPVQGWVSGPEVWVSTAGGAALVWLQVEGFK